MATKIPDIIIQPFDPFATYNTFSDEYITRIVALANNALEANKLESIKESKLFIPSLDPQDETEPDVVIPLEDPYEFDTNTPATTEVVAPVQAKANEKKKGLRIPKELRAWIYAICTVLIVRGTGLLVPNRVEGQSMEPNYHSGNIVLTSKLARIDRYDPVTAQAPNGVQVIKRVIGLPGDTIEVREGHVYVNGKKTKEDFVNDKGYSQDTTTTEYQLQDGQYFICGDNRLNSTDSRYYGPVTKSQIHGQIIFTIPISFGGDS